MVPNHQIQTGLIDSREEAACPLEAALGPSTEVADLSLLVAESVADVDCPM